MSPSRHAQLFEPSFGKQQIRPRQPLLLRLTQEICGMKHDHGVDGRVYPLTRVLELPTPELHDPVIALEDGLSRGFASQDQELWPRQLDQALDEWEAR